MDESVLEHKILDAVGQGRSGLTQRDLSTEIGCSVSSVNFAMRLLAVKGFIKIAKGNPKELRYYLTPRGIVEKTVIVYNFIRQQRALYEDARNSLLAKLHELKETGVRSVAIYGSPPFVESALLYLISEGIHVSVVYVAEPIGMTECNKIPVITIDLFRPDCEMLVLLEPLADEHGHTVRAPKAICYPRA